MNSKLRILHIEDIQSDAELVERTLKRSGIEFDKIIVDSKEEYIKALDEFNPDVILSDHSLPAFNSLEALKILKHSGKNIPFILITATVSEEFAVSVMKDGASDYVLKDRLQRLPSAITNALGKYQSDTDRQIYLNKIFESEALFTRAELLAEFGTWRIDLSANSITWSAGTYLLLGYEKGEVEPSYENFLRNVHPEDAEQVESIFRKALNEIQPVAIDFRSVNREDNIRYLHVQFEFELNERGEASHVIGFIQDVTRSKLAQKEIERNAEEIKAASERQSEILNALPANVVLLNEAGKIVAVNESWKKFTLINNLGMPRYGIGFSYLAISEKATGVDPSTARKIEKGIREIISGQKNEFSIEYSCHSGNEKVWFQLIIAPLTDKTMKGAVIMHIDITARKHAEEQLLQSKANLQTIFENTDIAYVLCDSEQKVVSFNNRANEFCTEQFDKKLRVGSNAFTYFPRNKIPNVREAIQKVLNNEMVSYETSYDLADGTTKWYDVKWVGVSDAKNTHIGFILALKDINERKLFDLERDRITTDLVQRNKDLEQFTYIVSHNLRAPVANIMGLSNMLNNFDFDISENQEIKTALSTSITALDNMIMDLNQILQVSSRGNERIETILFRFLIEDVLLSLRHIIDSENATVKYNFDEADKILAIKSYMHSIFYNLILNGIKYRKPGADPIVSIVTRAFGDKIEIVFRDNGRGIEEKNLKNLFGLYKRFDTTVEGKGMGLFMVKMQVETMGGNISAESKPGVGTIFRLEFPLE